MFVYSFAFTFCLWCAHSSKITDGRAGICFVFLPGAAGRKGGKNDMIWSPGGINDPLVLRFSNCLNLPYMRCGAQCLRNAVEQIPTFQSHPATFDRHPASAPGLIFSRFFENFSSSDFGSPALLTSLLRPSIPVNPL